MPAHKTSTAADALGIEVDLERRLLWTRFRGIVSGEDIRAPIAELRERLRQLGKGFVQITDLTELEAMDIDTVPHLTKMMDASLAAGVARIIRVIPDPDKDIGFTLLSLTHYRGRVPITTCKTRQEAERQIAYRNK